MTTHLRNTLYIGLLIGLLGGCAPQARFFNVDVKQPRRAEQELLAGHEKIAIFPVIRSNAQDSSRLGTIAVELAEQLEQDKTLNTGSISVYSLPASEFRGFNQEQSGRMQEYTKDYLNSLMAESGCYMQLFISNLLFQPASVNRQGSYGEFSTVQILLPYSIRLDLYNTLQNSLLYTVNHQDSIYLQVTGTVPDKSVNSIIASHLPEISKKIGTILSGYLTTQWTTLERMLITYDGETDWETPYELAQDFKWQEAIEYWMQSTFSGSAKRAAFAAYNIAVGCEMTEQFPLAQEWIEFSLKKFPFKEAMELKTHLQHVQKQAK